MPIPRVAGKWNRAGLNRVTRHIAPWLPGRAGPCGRHLLSTPPCSSCAAADHARAAVAAAGTPGAFSPAGARDRVSP
jgi:hypothetical protein